MQKHHIPENAEFDRKQPLETESENIKGKRAVSALYL